MDGIKIYLLYSYKHNTAYYLLEQLLKRQYHITTVHNVQMLHYLGQASGLPLMPNEGCGLHLFSHQRNRLQRYF